MQDKQAQEAQIHKYFSENSIEPNQINPYLEERETAPIRQKTRLSTLLLRPQLDIKALMNYLPTLRQDLSRYQSEALEQAEINLKYAGYLEKEQEMVDKMQRLERITFGDSFDFQAITSLSIEAKEKLSKIKPTTLGQASRISGVSPSDLSVLLVYMGR